MSTCDRCGETTRRGFPLDAVVHPNTDWVCKDCLRGTDTVVDP